MTFEQAKGLVGRLRKSYQPDMTDAEILREARNTRERIFWGISMGALAGAICQGKDAVSSSNWNLLWTALAWFMCALACWLGGYWWYAGQCRAALRFFEQQGPQMLVELKQQNPNHEA